MMSVVIYAEQGRIHGSISRVRVGRGSMVAGQGQQLKSALLLALNAQKREVITDGRTDGPTDIVTYRVACTRLKIQAQFTHILSTLLSTLPASDLVGIKFYFSNYP